MQNENKNYYVEKQQALKNLNDLKLNSKEAWNKLFLSNNKEQIANDEGFKNAIDDIVTSSKQAAEFYNYITDSNYF